MTDEEMKDRLAQRLDGLGVAVDAHTAERLARYHELLVEWKGRVNLTSNPDFETALDKHYLDSLAPLALPGLIPQRAKLIDVGSGAGFPGLPLAIARPDLTVLLMDSLAKRLKFLDAVIAELRLENARTLHARAEDGAHHPACREQFDIAAARAVASAPVLMELLLPFVRTGGKAICYKGPSAQEEMLAGSRAARVLGGGKLACLPVAVPGQPDWKHCVLVSEKLHPTPGRFPRKAGTPGKEPLGADTARP